MKVRAALATVGLALGITATLAACGEDEPVAKDCWEWMSDDTLTVSQENVVWEGCLFSTLPMEDEPVTYAEIEVMYLDYKAREECVWSTVSSAECDTLLSDELTIEEVRARGLAENG